MPQYVFPEETWPTAAPASQGLDPAKLDAALRHLESIVDKDGISQTMVVRNGYVVYAGPYVHEWHNTFSCTKSFTAICNGLLIADGKCTYDTRACEIVPELEKDYADLTLAHFSALTSGYTGKNPNYPFTPGTPHFPAGTRFHYHNYSMNMYAYVLTLIAGEPLDALFKRRIADPIGMVDWGWGDFGYVNGVRVNNGGGNLFKGMHTSAREMARVGLLLLNEGKWNGTRLLPAGWVVTASRPQAGPDVPVHKPDDWYPLIQGAYGYNFWVNGVRPDGKRLWPDAPDNVFAIQGSMNNICLVVPEWDMVLVRMGTDKLIDDRKYTEVFAALRRAVE